MALKLLFLSVLACCGINCARAQETQPNVPQSAAAQALSLDEAVRTSLRQHPALKEAQAAVAAAEAEVRVARSAYFPQLSVSGIAKIGLAGATGALGLPGFPASPFYRNTAYSVNWYQSIFDFGRIKHLVAMDRAVYRSTQLRQMSEEQRIVLEVKQAYFSVLEAQRLEQLGEDTLAERSLTFERSKAYRQAELGSQLDLSLAEASLAEAEGALIHTRDAVLVSFAALRAAMGVAASDTYALLTPAFESISLPPLEELLREGIRDRPDEQALQFKITALRERLGLSRSESLPDIRGFAAAGEGHFSGTTVPENQRHGVGGLGVIAPLFTGGRLRAVRDEARAELEGGMAAEDLLRQQIRLEVTQAYYQLSDFTERLKAAYQQQQSAQEALSLAQARYEAELGSFLDVLTAQVAATIAETNYARMQFDYQRAQAQLDFATGKVSSPCTTASP
jgi:outer membrane protein